ASLAIEHAQQAVDLATGCIAPYIAPSVLVVDADGDLARRDDIQPLQYLPLPHDLLARLGIHDLAGLSRCHQQVIGPVAKQLHMPQRAVDLRRIRLVNCLMLHFVRTSCQRNNSLWRTGWTSRRSARSVS